MKLAKKLLSIALTCSMLPASVLSAQASETADAWGYDNSVVPASWTINYNTRDTSWNKNQDYAGITPTGGYAGSPGLIVNIESPSEAHKYIEVKQTLNGTLTAGQKYRVSFWRRTTADEYKTKAPFSVHLGGIGQNTVNSYDFISDASSNGFTNYYYDVTPSADVTTLHFVFERKMTDVIDAVSVRKFKDDGSLDSTNIVNNLNFDAKSYSFDVTGENYKSNSWNRLSGVAQPTKKFARTGDYALYINRSATDARIDNKLIPAMNKAGTYTVEFWFKGTYQYAWNVFVGRVWAWGSAHNKHFGAYTKGETDKNGWTKYSYSFTLTEAQAATADPQPFKIYATASAANFVIDDIAIYYGDDRTTNLLNDGGFEDTTINTTASKGDYEFDGWMQLFGAATPAADKGVSCYIEPSAAYKHGDGNYSLHLKHNYNWVSNNYTEARFNREFPAGKYDISFYLKKVTFADAANLYAGIGWNSHSIKAHYTAGTADADGWTKYEFNGVELGDNAYFHFMSDYTCDVYIDDLVITKSGESTNLIPEGDFEDVVATNNGYPTNVMASTTMAGSGLNISWVNPASSYIEDIKVYVNDVEKANSAINMAKSAFNEMYVEGLENYTDYNVKVTAKVGGSEYTTETAGTPDARGMYLYEGDWTIERQNVSGEHPNFIAELDTNEKYSDKASVKLSYNHPTEINNLYPNVQQTVTLDRNKEYILKYKMKNAGITKQLVLAQYKAYDADGNVEHSSWTYLSPEKTELENGWAEYTVELGGNVVCSAEGCGYKFHDTAEANVQHSALFRWTVNSGTGSIWIDDVGLYESDWGEPTGENVIQNGGFDYTYEILNPTYKLVTEDSSSVITDLVSGNIHVTARVKNYMMGADFDSAVIVALYDGAKLVEVSAMEKKLQPSSLIIPADEYTATVNVPALENGDYKIKVMYWNSLGAMEALDSADVIAEPIAVQ